MERKYIWLNDRQEYAYAEFKQAFRRQDGRTTLRITADYKYAAFVNGSFVGNAQFADIPEYKTFSEYDITPFVKAGENEIYIQAYHANEGASVCRVMTPCVAFEIWAAGELVCYSSEKTLCRRDTRYAVGANFSGQLGKGYDYSFTEEAEDWKNSRVVEPSFLEYDKPIKNTKYAARKCTVHVSGVFKKNGGDTAAAIMQRAWLQTGRFNVGDTDWESQTEFPCALTTKGEGDGVFVIGDLGCECAGYPRLSITCKEATTAYFGWGEHLTDLRLRVNRRGHGFAVKICLKKGKNDFSEYLRRIGCRYMGLYVEGADGVTIEEMGLMEELYPLCKPEKDFGDRLLNQIYETGRRTLELCMHEHYEDCPWREQALYGLDSRNQMLFGYGAFGEYEFPRASLRLIAKCVREDGWIPLVTPSELHLTIPPFSAYWIIAVQENVERDYQESFLREVIPAVERVMAACKENTLGNKIYPPAKKGCWNFHEWSEGLSDDQIWAREREGDTERNANVADGAFTALVCRAAKAAASLEARLDNKQKAKEYTEYARTLASGLYDFYDEEKSAFVTFLGKKGKYGYHEYTQTMFLLTDELQEREKQRVLESLKGEGASLVGITLSGLALKYEGLLKYSDSLDYVIEDISRIFGGMLFKGATSYWETERGEADFWNAGSLCHGWSAAACWVLDTYCKNLKNE